jgi:hypothetical protein
MFVDNGVGDIGREPSFDFLNLFVEANLDETADRNGKELEPSCRFTVFPDSEIQIVTEMRTSAVKVVIANNTHCGSIGFRNTSLSVFGASGIDEAKPVVGHRQEVNGVGVGFYACAGKENFVIDIVERVIGFDFANVAQGKTSVKIWKHGNEVW